MASPRVFINYRREDTSGYAGRLYDSMTAHFDEESVFMDIDLIQPGSDFVATIEEALAECDVLIALIGQHWVNARLSDPADFLRLELEAAIRRSVRIIPVLVQGAAMPSPGALPETLRPLCRRQAFELSDRRWRYDIDALTTSIDERLHPTSVTVAPPTPADVAAIPEPPPEPLQDGSSRASSDPLAIQSHRRRRRTWLIAGAAVASCAALAAIVLAVMSSSTSTSAVSAKHSPSTSTTVPSVPTTNAANVAAATAFFGQLDGVLRQSAAIRDKVAILSTDLAACRVSPTSGRSRSLELTQERQQLIGGLADIETPVLVPNGARLVTLLRAAEQESITSHVAWRSWMSGPYATAYSDGCTSSQVTADVTKAFDSAGVAKDAFIAEYNPAAAPYGVRADWLSKDF